MFLTKYRPYSDLDAFVNGCFPAGEASVATRSPLTNIVEKDDSFVLTLEVPGLEKKDIDISIENDQIIISGGKVEAEKAEVQGMLRREIRSTTFHRAFQIGKRIDRENIKAKLDHGVLTVTLKKTEEQVGRKVEVD